MGYAIDMSHASTIFRFLALLTMCTFGATEVIAQQTPAAWRRTAEVSGTLLYGAASQRVFNATVGAASESEQRQLRVDVQTGYGDAVDQVTGLRRVIVRNTRGTMGLDLTPQARVSAFTFGLAESSLQQRIRSRYSLGAGAKYTLWRADSVRARFQEDASISLAVLSEQTRGIVASGGVAGRGDGNRNRWSVRARYRTRVGESLRFTHLSLYQPTMGRLGRYTAEATTTLAVPLRSAVELTISHRERLDSEARDRGASSNRDGQLLFGVRAAF